MKRTIVVLVSLSLLAEIALAQTAVPSYPSRVSAPEADVSPAREVVIGSAVPSGPKFIIRFDERNIDWAYPEWARPLPGARTVTVSKEQFRSAAREAVTRKLTAMFPNGLPPDAASRIKIEINIKLSKPPEFTVKIEF